jgi:MFS family permease
MVKVLAQRDFRLLWLGQTISVLGDQFSLIALPWLVLQLTHDPLALGVVLALAGVPRAVCMLLGGAVTDRFNPRAIMLITDLVRLALWALTAALVATGAIQLWMLYVLSVLFGASSGFFIPAANAIVPRLVGRKDLEAGNSLVQGCDQLAQSIGPALAGGLIAWFAHVTVPGAVPTLGGIAVAFGVDALSFAVSVVTLWAIAPLPAAPHASREAIAESILSGVRYVWGDAFLRALFILIAMINFLFVGPLMVGVPVLASTRLVEGAAAYGIVMSAYALGNLAGILGAGALPRLDARKLSILLVAMFAGFGLCLAAFAWVRSTGLVAAMLLVLGVGNGYLAVTLITMLQRRTPTHLMARLMSLVMLASMGLVPVSQALSGAISRWSLTGLFEIAGALTVLVAVGTAFQEQFRPQALSEAMAYQPAAD